MARILSNSLYSIRDIKAYFLGGSLGSLEDLNVVNVLIEVADGMFAVFCLKGRLIAGKRDV